MSKTLNYLSLSLPLPTPCSPYQGYFSLLALAHGCRVVAFEPQAVLWPFIANSLQLNSFDPENLALVPCALSSADSQPGECLLANEHPNWGEFSLVKSQVGGTLLLALASLFLMFCSYFPASGQEPSEPRIFKSLVLSFHVHRLCG